MVFIKISYGPYLAHGVIRHRIQRLRALLRHLTKLGYEIEVVEVNLFNRVEIEMFERRIFIGDIRNFKFNEAYEDDPVCQTAVAAVEEAKSRMTVEENVRKFIPIEQGMRYVERVSHVIDTQEFLLDSELLFEIPDKQRPSTIPEETSDFD